MNVVLRVLGSVCILFAILAIISSPRRPQQPEALKHALDDAFQNLAWPWWAHAEPTNDVTIARATLKTLDEQAQVPMDDWRFCYFFSRTTFVFALVSGVSLFLLSKKKSSVPPNLEG